MRHSIFSLLVFALVSLVSVVAIQPLPAHAEQHCESVSCRVAQFQATRQPYRGPLSEDRVDTCIRFLFSTLYAAMSGAVLVAGPDPVKGQVIASLGRDNGHAFQVAGQPGTLGDVHVREFCFNRSQIAGYDTITLCNERAPGDGNHHTLSLNDPDTAPYLRNLLNTGHAGHFLTLLGTESYARTGTFFTADLYGSLYGKDGRWRY